MIDTSVLIDAARGRGTAGQWLAQAAGNDDTLLVSTVTVAEYASGIAPELLGRELEYLMSLTVVPVTTSIAIRAGEIRFVLARQGRAVALPDALIAATALDAGAGLLTANVRHFVVDGLRLVEPVVDPSS